MITLTNLNLIYVPKKKEKTFVILSLLLSLTFIEYYYHKSRGSIKIKFNGQVIFNLSHTRT